MTVCVRVPVAPRLSVTDSVTLGAGAAYACPTASPSPIVPSPKFQAYFVICPSESVEGRPLKVHVRPVQSAVNEATGGVLLTLEITTVCCAAPRPAVVSDRQCHHESADGGIAVVYRRTGRAAPITEAPGITPQVPVRIRRTGPSKAHCEPLHV